MKKRIITKEMIDMAKARYAKRIKATPTLSKNPDTGRTLKTKVIGKGAEIRSPQELAQRKAEKQNRLKLKVA